MPSVRRFLLPSLFLLGTLMGIPAPAQQPAPPDVPTPRSRAEDYVRFGLQNGKAGDVGSAVNSFDEAIKIDPSFAPAYENRGVARMLQQKLDDAMSDFDEAIRLNPNYADAFYRRAVIKGEKGDFPGAIADSGSALQLEPKLAPAYYNRGHAKYFTGDLAGALADLHQAISLTPDVPYPYYIRGLVRHAQNDLDGADADFQKCAATGFANGAWWHWIIRMEQGDRTGARKDLSNFLAQSQAKPDSLTAQMTGFLLERVSRDQMLAITAADAGGKESQCLGWFYLGMVQRFSGDTKGSISSFKAALATRAADAEESIEAQRQLALAQAQ